MDLHKDGSSGFPKKKNSRKKVEEKLSKDGKVMGRPSIEIDYKIFENLCKLMCTQSEIASFFGIHRETLEHKIELHYNETFATVYKAKTEVAKCSLRRLQWKHAERNYAMCIWLGKQYLGQKEHTEITQTSPYEEVNNFKHENMILRNTILELQKKIGNNDEESGEESKC